MNRTEEWTMFLENLMACATDDYRVTPAYEIRKQHQEQLDSFLAENLTTNQKKTIEEILVEIGMAEEGKIEAIYRQGLKDCAWLLKNLGVLA